MALIDQIARICSRLATGGWAALLRRHGLDIEHPELADELARELTEIDRSAPGFEDFAPDGVRGVEPGDPARSLLYHALASPGVVTDDRGQPLQAFPTPAEIDLVENYVFAARRWSLRTALAHAGDALVAVAVFAHQYRRAPGTVHGRHADMCLARTGLARVGTSPARYDGPARGFLPFADDPHAVRVLPSRFAAYIAVQRVGSTAFLGPRPVPGDDQRLFWVPLHKLFTGPECLVGHDLTVEYVAEHTNEKIRRIHVHFDGEAGWGPPDIDQPPFIFHDGIAEMSSAAEDGPGVLVPIVHERLVDEATYQGSPLAFRVPPSDDVGLGPSLFIPSGPNDARNAPEFVHVRHLLADGGVRDLNDDPDVTGRVFAGGYDALHYLDYTGDGWVRCDVAELAVEVPRSVPAYSLVASPDFYPSCSQRELLRWWNERLPSRLRDLVAWNAPPETLADDRMPANLQLDGVDFRAEDETVTALVSLGEGTPGATGSPPLVEQLRHSPLPDAAAGLFAPGWDTSRASTGEAAHLAAFGLGSPFPEDAKLCAALSAFWPAVAPDTGRTFSHSGDRSTAAAPPFRTVTPMTDAEIGSQGQLPWDGVPGPNVVQSDGEVAVDYASFDHVDYVRSALDNRFTLAITGRVDTETYEARILAMARAYQAAGVSLEQANGTWGVLSFRELGPDEALVVEAQQQTGRRLSGQIHAVVLTREGRPSPVAGDHRRVLVPVEARVTVLVGALALALVRFDEGAWEARPVA